MKNNNVVELPRNNSREEIAFDGHPEYSQFLLSKMRHVPPRGFTPDYRSDYLFAFQKAIVDRAIQRGRCAIFAGTGLGKSRMQIAWAQSVSDYTNKPVLILAPLCVGVQTEREALSVGIATRVCKYQSDIGPGLNMTNYDRLANFDSSEFGGIVADESSIMKSFSGATTNAMIEFARDIPYRLPCTATPSPNDYTELGNHAEFLGICTREEMLATYFCHDGGDTSVWRLRGWARARFWEWVASWAIACRTPGDVGFPDEDARYILPPLTINDVLVDSDMVPTDQSSLFVAEAVSLTEQRIAKRSSLTVRCERAAAIVAAKNDTRISENQVSPNNGKSVESIVVWCHLNDEQDYLEDLFGGDCVSIRGSTPNDERERLHTQWLTGEKSVMICKQSQFGYGLNWQHCANAVFVGVDHSYERMYQAIRRNYRFGQKRPVTISLILSEQEFPIMRNLRRKEMESEIMQIEMIAAMESGKAISESAVAGQISAQEADTYRRDTMTGNGWTAHLGDCVDVMRGMDDNSIDYSIFSPPFKDLYTYSNSHRDLGNVANDGEFYEQFSFAVREMYRVLKPGRLISFHCMTMPSSKTRDGFIGAQDFRGKLIRLFESCGFYFHSEVTIWKDPVVAMQRTKAIGLLHKQLVKDSGMSRQGFADYLVTMRKPGNNDAPIAGELVEYHGEDDGFTSAVRGDKRGTSIGIWQRYASPVWMDINPNDTLQHRSARESSDERHICPLQLTVIRRGIQLWSNPGDTVLSPFAGIGSEGFVALEMGRQFVGAELKESYWNQQVANLRRAETASGQMDMSGDMFSEECEL